MKKLPVAVTEEEFKNLIKHTKQKHHKIAFLLGFGSGLRISEVTNLEKRDIHIKEKKIDIREGKGSKDRVVPLPKGFSESMIKHIPFKCGVRSLQIAFKRYSKLSGLLEKKPSVHFHSLRHGFASRLIENKVPIHHVKMLLGHSNISTTNVYLVANPQDALKSYEEYF